MNESALYPELVLKLVASHVPPELHSNLLIVGSLAAAYDHRVSRDHQPVRTKDADVVVQPAGALEQCRDVAEQLLAAGWRRTEQCWPCTTPTPMDDLRIIRLYPPETNIYFIELLGLPLPDQQTPKHLEPCKLRDGWYAVPCFRYMALFANDRKMSAFGIEYASPALMALANLLSHPTLGVRTIGNTKVLRSSKDLGRVLALHFLASDEELETWPRIWWAALQQHFPDESSKLAARVAHGISELLDSGSAFNDAFDLVNRGLLSGRNITREQLRITAARLMNDVVCELHRLANLRL